MAAIATTTATSGDAVAAYIDVYSPFSHPLRDTKFVRVVRDFCACEFHFVDAVHGKLYTLYGQRANKVLSQLVDQGHIIGCPNKAIVDVEGSRCRKIEGDLVKVHFWVRIKIRRESVELVSRRIFLEAFLPLFLVPRIGVGGFNDENSAFHEVLKRWKSSKHFRMESEKDANGDGMSPPANVIKAELFDHQKQGLRWMIDREELPPLLDQEELPPFWEEFDGMFRCELTYLITKKRPSRIRGGILADESGMGKTLTLLSLVAFTAVNNRNNVVIGKKRKPEEVDVDFEWRPTLVVCPSSVLATWKTQIEQFARPGSLKVCIYHGKGKTRDPDVLQRHDLVLTTYNTIVKEKEQKEESDSRIFHQIDWWRVVLDDVHVLKSSKSRATTPFLNLKAERRWVVTGKPVHKDCENYNLYPIMAFLQVQPLCDIVIWDTLVGFHVKDPRFQCQRLKILMDILALRRTMPAISIENYLVVLSKDEQDLYNSMESEANRVAGLGFRQLQAAVLHLWQSCNSLAMCRLSCAELASSANFQDLNGEPKLLEKWVTVLQEEKDYACPVCLDQPEDIIVTRCAHFFCRSCILRMFEKCKKSFCALCRRPLAKRDIFCSQSGPSVMELKKSIMEGESSFAMSSKVSSLLSLLIKLRTEKPHRKSVVVSQFRRMLLLLEGLLSNEGFDVRRLDVIDNAKTKATTIKEFGNADPPVVLLTSFKALSDTPGLDLSAAPNIYMMEPCWNAHTEEEALGRIYRLGKKDDVNAVRFVCKNSIEERVLEMRNQKVAYGSSNSKREVNISDKKDFRQLLGLYC